jgi:hypothetical protein
MLFVPFIPSSPPSPRAHELGRRLQETIDNFRRENPGTTGTDVRQAIGLATRGESAANQSVLIALTAGLVLLGLLAFYFFSRQSGETSPTLAMAIIFAAIVIIGLKAFLRNR